MERLTLPEVVSQDTIDCITLSQCSLERACHKARSSVVRLKSDIKRYSQSHYDALPEILQDYDAGKLSGDDMREIVSIMAEEFGWIVKQIDKAVESANSAYDEGKEYLIDL